MSFGGGASGPIASAFVEVTANTEPAIKSILAIASSFSAVEEEAALAAEGVAAAFREAAQSANRSLRGIGGAGTFGELEAESAVAGEAIGNNVEGGSSKASSALGFLKTGTVALATALAAGGAAMVTFGLKSAASLEQTRISFTALLGSAQEADKFIRQMQDFAAKTPFEFAGLADNARALLATSSALKITRDQIIPTIGVIGDLVSVLGAPPEAIDRVITAFSQMASKGKASTEEVMQLAEALPGFPVFDAMAKGLGISTAALQDQLSKGLIPADKGVQALLKGMREFPGAAGAMAQQATTLNGLFSTFKDTISLTLTDAFAPLVDNVKNALGPLTDVIGSVLKDMAPQVTQIATILFNALIPLIKVVGPGVTDIFKSFATVLGPVADALTPVIGLISKLVSTILPPLATVIATVVKALTPFITALTTVVSRLLDVLAPILIKIADAFATVLGPSITEVATIIGNALIRILDELAPHLDEIATLLSENLIQSMVALAPLLPPLAIAFTQLSIALAELIIALLPVIPPLIQLGTLFITHISAPVLLLVANAIQTLAGALATLIGWVTGLLAPLQNTSTNLTTVKDQALEWATNITTFLQPALSGLKTVFTDITNLLGPLATNISTILKPAWDDLKTNTVTPFTDLIEFRLIPKLNELKDTALTGLANFITTTLKPVWDDFRVNSLQPFVDMLEVRAINAVFGLFIQLTTLGNTIAGFLKPIVVDFKVNAWDPLVNAWNSQVMPALNDLIGALFRLWNTIAPIVMPSVQQLRDQFNLLAGVITSILNPTINEMTGTVGRNANTMQLIAVPAAIALRVALFGVDITAFALKTTAQQLTADLSILTGILHVAAFAADVVNGAFHALGGAIDSIKGAISSLIGDASRLVDIFRNLTSIHLPSLPSFPGIPGFAAGGIVDRDQLAMLHAPEVVIPLNDPKRAAALLSASGILDTLTSRPASGALAGAASVSASVGAGLTVGSISVTVHGNVTTDQARDTGAAIVSGIEETIRQRQLAFTVRTV